MDITKLSNDTLRRLGTRAYQLVEYLMTRDPEGLTFGWDWPTARVCWPVYVNVLYRIQDEWKRRGNGKATMADEGTYKSRRATRNRRRGQHKRR